MTRIGLALPALICLSIAGQPQAQVPRLLLRAAQCLATKGFLEASGATTMTFGFFLDAKSYTPDTLIYVVNFAARAPTNGFVYTVFLKEKDGTPQFDIQNNAAFALAKEGDYGVEWVTPPLGGGWTQQHLALAIKRIERQHRYAIAVALLRAPDPSLHCRAYTDPQPTGDAAK